MYSHRGVSAVIAVLLCRWCLGTYRTPLGDDGSLCLVASKSLLAPFEEKYLAGASGGKPHDDTACCNLTSVTAQFPLSLSYTRLY